MLTHSLKEKWVFVACEGSLQRLALLQWWWGKRSNSSTAKEAVKNLLRIHSFKSWILQLRKKDLSDRRWSGRPSAVVNACSHYTLHRSIIIVKLCESLLLSYENVCSLIQFLGYSKVCVKWVPMKLTYSMNDQKVVSVHEVTGSQVVDLLLVWMKIIANILMISLQLTEEWLFNWAEILPAVWCNLLATQRSVKSIF